MTAITANHKIVAKQLSDHQYRLVSLQVTLQESYRAGLIDTNDYQKRSVAINEQLQLLKGLGAWSAAEEAALTQEANLGLPNIDQCTSEEKRICYEFLKDRHLILEQLVKDSSRLLDWVESATYARTGLIAQTMQLSTLRKKIAELEGSLNGVSLQDQDLEKMTHKLCQTLSKGKSGQDFKANMEFIMRLFDELDAVSARIAQLKYHIRSEEDQILNMKTWLQKERAETSEPLRFTEPPTPEQTAKASFIPQPPEKQYVTNTFRRLELAEQYIKTCLKQTETDNERNYPRPDPRTSAHPPKVKAKHLRTGRYK